MKPFLHFAQNIHAISCQWYAASLCPGKHLKTLQEYTFLSHICSVLAHCGICTNAKSLCGTVRHASFTMTSTHNCRTNANIDHVDTQDDRRIEVIANGLPLWGGAQLAVDTTLVSPLTRAGHLRMRGGQYRGTALRDARRNKERTYPEPLRDR